MTSRSNCCASSASFSPRAIWFCRSRSRSEASRAGRGGGVLEDAQRVVHRADLVLAAEHAGLHREIARGEAPHRVGQLHHRPRDHVAEEERRGERSHGGDRRDRDEDEPRPVGVLLEPLDQRRLVALEDRRELIGLTLVILVHRMDDVDEGHGVGAVACRVHHLPHGLGVVADRLGEPVDQRVVVLLGIAVVEGLQHARQPVELDIELGGYRPGARRIEIVAGQRGQAIEPALHVGHLAVERRHPRRAVECRRGQLLELPVAVLQQRERIDRKAHQRHHEDGGRNADLGAERQITQAHCRKPRRSWVKFVLKGPPNAPFRLA